MRINRLRLISPWLVAVLLVILTSACSLLGQEEPTPVADTSVPEVSLTLSIEDETTPMEQEVVVQSTSVDDRAITRVELLINGEAIRVDANADPQPNTPFIVAQPWTPDTPGVFAVQIRAFNTANVRGESASLMVTVTDGTVEAVSDAASPDTPTPAVEEAATETPLPVPTAVPTQTLLPTDTPIPPEPTATPAPTNTLAPQEPTPAPLVAGPFSPTNFEVEGRFFSVWEQLGAGDGPLGYPTDKLIKDRNYAKQYFAGGIMIWWDNPNGDNPIWVVKATGDTFQSGNRWISFEDTWNGGGDYSCDAARENGERGPVRGFGKIWCEHQNISSDLGKPVEREGGSAGNTPYSEVQLFQGGIMFYNPLNTEVYVLYGQGSNWRQFGY